MSGRAELSTRVAHLVGNDVLEITDPGTGWPALGTLLVEGTAVEVSLFVGTVGLSHRGRDTIERRFQNPGQDRPIIEVPGRAPLLLGLWELDEHLAVRRPLLVSADPHHRMDRMTRFSIFTSIAVLQLASTTGWAEDENATGESIRCFVPPMLPLSFAVDRDGMPPPSVAMQAAIEGSGLLDASPGELPAASERARRAGTTLVRDARFSRRVIDAYAGQCAMCGLSVRLVEGAHIYPAAAPGSHDEPWNGLALCANHHLAFDKHLVGVDPDTLEIVFHEDIRRQAAENRAVAAFLSVTFAQLAPSLDGAVAARREMLIRRYRHFPDRYDWLHDP